MAIYINMAHGMGEVINGVINTPDKTGNTALFRPWTKLDLLLEAFLSTSVLSVLLCYRININRNENLLV